MTCTVSFRRQENWAKTSTHASWSEINMQYFDAIKEGNDYLHLGSVRAFERCRR